MKLDVETLLIVLMLLPGFLGVAVFSLLKRSKIGPANTVIFAFSICISANFFATKFNLASPPIALKDLSGLFQNVVLQYLLVVSLISCLMSILLLWITQSNWFNSILYESGIQRHFSEEPLWDRVFKENDGKWVVLEYVDGSKVVGYAKWYSQGEREHALCLGNAEVIYNKKLGKLNKRMVVEKEGDYVIMNFSDVRAIEFRN